MDPKQMFSRRKPQPRRGLDVGAQCPLESPQTFNFCGSELEPLCPWLFFGVKLNATQLCV